MTETELRYFIETVIGYFERVTGVGAKMGIPYVKNQDSVVLDYTGLIGISGPRKGGICVSASRGMLERMTGIVLGEETSDHETLLDMVGEITNTIAGNLQKYFGQEFQISVPMVVTGRPDDVTFRLKPPVFVIPFEWQAFKAYLVVGLE